METNPELVDQGMSWLMQALPLALVLKAGSLGGIVIAIVQFLRRFPKFEENKKVYAPAASAVLGLIGGFASVGFDMSQAANAAGTGVLIFLIAVGGHSTYKNILQQLQAKNQAQTPGAATQPVAQVAASQQPPEQKK